MKIRMHRGGLAEAMETATEIPCTVEAVKKYISVYDPGMIWSQVNVECVLYSDAPDTRIGWNRTFLIKVNGATSAFTDEPLVRSIK